MENGKKVSLHRFVATQKITISWKKKKKCRPLAQATSFCLLPDTLCRQTFKNAFKVGTVNFVNLLSPPSIVKKVHTGSKNSQGT